MKKVVQLPIRRNDMANAPVSLTDQDDDTLMVMARCGEMRAFDALVRRYQQMVLGIARKYLGDPLSAEDAAQNSFIDLYRAIHTYRPEGKLRAFLTRIVINSCRMTRRRIKSEINIHQAFAEQTVAEVHDLPHDSPKVYQMEQQRLLEQAVCGLRPKLKEVVVLRYAAGLSYQEISEALNIRTGTVKSRLFAAIERLGCTLEALEK